MRDHPLAQLTLARMREFYREPEAIFWVFGFPIVLAFALGIAFRNRGPGELRVAVLRQAGESALAPALAHAPGLAVVVLDSGTARLELRTGRVALLVVPGEHVVYRYDSTRTEGRLARLQVDDAVQRARGRADPVRVEDERVTEPGARYIDFLIPGLLGMNLMGSGLWGVGFSVVQARTKRLLKRYMATPMRRSHCLLSFVLSRLVFLFVELAALVGFGWWIFGVGVRGSFGALTFITVLGALAFNGLGMLIASRARTIEAVSGLMNLVMLPMWILSGTFFSYARFPEAMQPFVRALPLTALNDALRAVMIDGSPVAQLGRPPPLVGLDPPHPAASTVTTTHRIRMVSPSVASNVVYRRRPPVALRMSSGWCQRRSVSPQHSREPPQESAGPPHRLPEGGRRLEPGARV